MKKKVTKGPGPKEFVGKVISDKMEKTVVVEVIRAKPHPLYRKVVRRRKKFYAHDEKGAKMGDWVRIRETRPLSKLKRFVVVEIVRKEEK
ncbi:30S ribosomal protein S17 [bacterium]|nr:30S ribosomal protein S17 [bacterium]